MPYVFHIVFPLFHHNPFASTYSFGRYDLICILNNAALVRMIIHKMKVFASSDDTVTNIAMHFKYDNGSVGPVKDSSQHA